MTNKSNIYAKWAGGLLLVASLSLSAAWAQDRDRDRGERDRYRDDDRVTRVEPGTVIPVRLNQRIDVQDRDNRVYTGTVEQDVRGNNGRLAIPRGSNVELMVRVAPDNDLILDLDSVMVNGQRYAVRSDPNRMDSRRDDSVVGSIIGAISGGQVRGRTVRVPRGTVVTFRLERGLDMGVADHGSTRDGNHYHDYYRPDRQ